MASYLRRGKQRTNMPFSLLQCAHKLAEALHEKLRAHVNGRLLRADVEAKKMKNFEKRFQGYIGELRANGGLLALDAQQTEAMGQFYAISTISWLQYIFEIDSTAVREWLDLVNQMAVSFKLAVSEAIVQARGETEEGQFKELLLKCGLSASDMPYPVQKIWPEVWGLLLSRDLQRAVEGLEYSVGIAPPRIIELMLYRVAVILKQQVQRPAPHVSPYSWRQKEEPARDVLSVFLEAKRRVREADPALQVKLMEVECQLRSMPAI